MNAPAAVDLSPAFSIALLGLAIALPPVAWLAWRRRHDGAPTRLRALAVLTLFLTFDLVLLGAYTRLSDSGLGCPDWPGCYGHASPIGASAPIAGAEAAMPTGAVTRRKAWTEMAHRYAATAVGALVALLAALTIVQTRRVARSQVPRGRADAGAGPPAAGRARSMSSAPRPLPPVTDATPSAATVADAAAARRSAAWAVATFLWVCVQGAFGALTVTMALAPAIVTLHLLGGFALLALLAVQVESHAPRPVEVSPGLRAGVLAVAALAVAQMALGGWVSTNYAVLACGDFPTCQGSWWPPADFATGFELVRPLGASGAGDYLPFAALTAIHLAHRLGAAVVLPALLLLAWALHRRGGPLRSPGLAIAAIAAWQLASGLSNVLLGWPLLAAVAHTGCSAALVVVLTRLLVRTRPAVAARHPEVGVRPIEAS